VIASVSGAVLVRRADHVVVECAGVGYRTAVSTETLRQVPGVGKQTTLHTHLVMRDDAISLFGFGSEDERALFLLLIGVQGVGPKVALAVLSGGTTRELTNAIAAGDSARFQAAPGVGKRTAERIIVELRDKVGAGARADQADGSDPLRNDDPRSLAREGLEELGYAPAEIEELLRGVTGDTPEALIAAALKASRR